MIEWKSRQTDRIRSRGCERRLMDSSDDRRQYSNQRGHDRPGSYAPQRARHQTRTPKSGAGDGWAVKLRPIATQQI